MNKGESALPSWVPRFEAGDPFLKSWFDEECMNERRRILLRSKAGAVGSVTNLHDLVTDYLHFKNNAFLDTLPRLFQALAKTPRMEALRPKLAEEGILPLIGKEFVGLMTSPDAANKLRDLAEIVDMFPVHKGNLYFGDYLSTPSWFKPTIQDGLKGVMLGVFFALVEKRPLAPESLPTIGELDALVQRAYRGNNKSKDKKPPGEKELREARRELGLSGLPRGKGGRPKKQRGKK